MRDRGAVHRGRYPADGTGRAGVLIRVVPAALAALSVAPLGAQQRPQVRVSAQAIAVLTTATPVPRDRALTELRVVQPVIAALATTAGGRLSLLATLNLEGATIPNGELAPGTWGEGFMDRRHPHTYAHELLAIAQLGMGRWRGSAALGKGFVPFGTDDPMSRPPVRYPVNHHFSQILERALFHAAVGAGPVVLEAATFNGDEPERPDQWPNLDRFGDSWSLRLTVTPRPGLESQVSRARVRSPEHRGGAAAEQWKWSASARWDGPIGKRHVYGLVEWARTAELDGFFVFHSALVEGAAALGRHRPYVRLERTERPEEERLLDPFRARRPHFENTILGITRWSVVTGGYTVAGPGRRVKLWPFVELSHAWVTNITGGVFSPDDFYGKATIWSASFGVRLDAGMSGHRMGRYGVLSATPHEH